MPIWNSCRRFRWHRSSRRNTSQRHRTSWTACLRGKLDDGEELYLDALSDLVAAYEDEHYPISAASDADMLRDLMEARGVSQAEVSRETGIAKSTISEVLAGKQDVQPAVDPQVLPILPR